VPAMAIYEKFARAYSKGGYSSYSERAVEMLLPVLERLDIHPTAVLDLACGDGTFAIGMAKRGFRVTGADASLEMLKIAREKAREENAQVEFLQRDMKELDFLGQFDLVTCWFDSLNYLLEMRDLERAFDGVSRALLPGGFFVFDMNTVYGLAVGWQRLPVQVQVDSEDVLVLSRCSFDHEKSIATMRITGFMWEGDSWTRMDEEHKERGYTLAEIRQALGKAGFEEMFCVGNLPEMTPAKPDNGRVWFLVKKA